MFGISRIARYTRRWRYERQRSAIQNVILGLPLELQKDIGWPALREPSSPRTERSGIHARPIL